MCLAALSCILSAWISLPVSAEPLTAQQVREMEKQIEEKIDEIRQEVNHPEYFDGGCAEWTSDQLRLNEIGYWYKGYYNYGFDDGNKWFNDLDAGAVTQSGYTQVKYGGDDALTDLLAEFGGYPVYNVVICFERGSGKWESAGHVVYLWAIYDGYVYYADTFDQFFYKAGHMIKQPMDDFLSIYREHSGAVIGVVHFEGAEQVHYHPDEQLYCEYITVRDTVMRSIPVESEGGVDTAIEQVPAGTALSVSAAYTGEDGVRYLKVSGGRWVAYADMRKSANYSTLSASGVTVPLTWCYHQGFTMAGTVTSHFSDLTRVSVTISDMDGNVLVGGEQKFTGAMYSISALDENTYFEHFKPGDYRYVIEAENAREHAVLLDEVFTVVDGNYKDSQQTVITSEESTYAPADVDMSGTVDAQDFSYGMSAVLGGQGSYYTDANGDGLLNLTDLAVIAQTVEGK